MVKKNWSITMEEELFDETKMIAESEMRSLNQQMVLFIKEGINNRKKNKK